jgi:hypothetical protein
MALTAKDGLAGDIAQKKIREQRHLRRAMGYRINQ